MSRPKRKNPSVRPAVYVLVVLSAGILFDRWLNLWWWIALAFSIVALVCWWLGQWLLRTKENVMALTLLSAAIFFAGAFWHHGRWNWFSPHNLVSYCVDEVRPVCLRARVLGEAKFMAKAEAEPFDAMPTTERTRFLARASAIRDGLDWQPARGLATLTVRERIEHVSFGDEILVYGRLVPNEPPTSPGRFDFQEFLRSKGQLVSVHALNGDSVIVEHRAPRRSNAAILSALRKKLNELIWRHLDSDQAGFASAILLGNREQLTPDQQDSFLTTGTMHLLAISGLHVGILAGIFLIPYRLGLLRLRWALMLTILFVVFYAWLVEFRPPATRAAILVALYCCGRLIGRSGFEFNLLAAAGLVVLSINPTDLFALGPQLSFLAMAILITFRDWIFPPLSADPIVRLIRNTRPWPVRMTQRLLRRCRQALMVSGLIWLIGLPLVAANFHVVTPVALLVNPLVLIPIAFALYFGLAACLFGFIWPTGADAFGKLCSTSLDLVTVIIESADRIAWGHWWTAGPPEASVVVFYLMMLVIAVFLKWVRKKWIVVLWLGWVSLGWLMPVQSGKVIERIFPRDPRYTVIDVGHGSSVLLQLPTGKTVLCDAGSMVSSNFATETIAAVLWSKQIEHLDAIVISHADLDHFNGVPGLLRRFSVGEILMGAPMFDPAARTPSVQALFDEIKRAAVPIRSLQWIDQANLPLNASIRVLLPPPLGTGGNDNANSVVLSVDAGGQRLLLPADLEDEGMDLLLSHPPIDCEVALLPHHGSRNSQPEPFVDWCRPEIVIVSVGSSKIDRQVVNAIRSSDCQVFPTADFGTIQIEAGKRGILVFHWSQGGWQPLTTLLD